MNLLIIGKIIIYFNCEEIPPLHLTPLIVSKLGSETLAGMPFIMLNQIITNTPYNKSIINIKFTLLYKLTLFYYLLNIINALYRLCP